MSFTWFNSSRTLGFFGDLGVAVFLLLLDGWLDSTEDDTSFSFSTIQQYNKNIIKCNKNKAMQEDMSQRLKKTNKQTVPFSTAVEQALLFSLFYC